IAGECVRCLEPVTATVTVELMELYAYPERDRAAADEGADEEDEVGRLAGDLIDLEPRLRDAVLLALPLQPVCQADCPGLCAGCGVRLADAPPDHSHDQLDPRWAALAHYTEHEES